MSQAGLVVVGVGGFTSNVGKTTLMCELLKALPGWEAIKTTRGHYRSCGKDPHACCVSHLLGDEPTVFSGRDKTYQQGKDTGRYWDAGASNVHWVIATEDQVGLGIKTALERVSSPGVVVEGNSFSAHVHVDLMIMVAGLESGIIKRSARRALGMCSAVFVPEPLHMTDEDARPRTLQRDSRMRQLRRNFPGLQQMDFPKLVNEIQLLSSTPTHLPS